MKLWRKQAAEHEQLQPLVDALPDVLQQAALTTAAAVWREAQALAASRLDAERQALAQAQEAIEAEQAETVELVALLERDLELSRKELADVIAKATDAERMSNSRITHISNECENVKAELTKTIVRAERAEARAVELERRADDLRSELDRAHKETDKMAATIVEQKTAADGYMANIEHEKEKNAQQKTMNDRLLEQYNQVAADIVKVTEKYEHAIEQVEKTNKAKEVTDKENHEAAIKAAAAAAQISSLEKQVSDLLDRLEKVNTENKKAKPKN